MVQSWKFVGLLAICSAISFATVMLLPGGWRRGPEPPPVHDVVAVTGDGFNLSWNIDAADARQLLGKTVTISAQLRTTVGQKFGLQIYDGFADGRSTLHDGDGKWQSFSASHVIGLTSKLVRLRFVYVGRLGSENEVLIKDLRASVDGKQLLIDDSALVDGARSERLMSRWNWDGGAGKVRVVRTTF